MSASTSARRLPITPETPLLTGRVAVVTGAAQGIGEATALTLARFGADVAVCDKLPEGLDATAAELEAMGRTVVSEHMDVRDDEAVTRWFGRIAEQWGRVDILVNNAGGGFHAKFLDVSAKGQTALVNENFTQVTSCIRAAVPLMTDGGSIVNVTSIEAHRAGPGFGIYSAMKAAVANLSKTLALELADRHIRVNCVAPDVIPHPGRRGVGRRRQRRAGRGLPAAVARGWDDLGLRGGDPVPGRRPQPVRDRHHRPSRRRHVRRIGDGAAPRTTPPTGRLS